MMKASKPPKWSRKGLRRYDSDDIEWGGKQGRKESWRKWIEPDSISQRALEKPASDPIPVIPGPSPAA